MISFYLEQLPFSAQLFSSLLIFMRDHLSLLRDFEKEFISIVKAGIGKVKDTVFDIAPHEQTLRNTLRQTLLDINKVISLEEEMHGVAIRN